MKVLISGGAGFIRSHLAERLLERGDEVFAIDNLWRDAWPTIAEGAKSPHDVIVHNVTPWSGAIRVGDWKLVHNGGHQANAPQAPKQETLELFNIAEDPGEQNDQRERKPEIFARMHEQLKAIRATAVKPVLPPDVAPKGFKAPAVWGER